MKRVAGFRNGFREFRRSIVWQLLGRQKGWIASYVFLAICGFGVALSTLRAIRDVVDKAIDRQTMPLEPYVGMLVFLVAVGFVIGLTNRQVAARIGYQLEYDLRTWLYDTLQSANPRKLDTMASGQLVTRAMTDLLMLELLIAVIPGVAVGLTLLLAIALLVLVLNPGLGLIAISVVPVNLFIVTRIRRRLWAMSWVTLNRKAEVTTVFDEAVRGIRVVKAFGREDHERRRLADAARASYGIVINRVRLVARYDIFLKALPIFANAVIIVLAGRVIADRGFTLGDLLIFLLLSGVITGFAQSFDEIASIWLLAKSGAGRIFDLIALADVGHTRAYATAPETGSGLVLERASVEVFGRTVLGGVDLAVGPGELVVLTGGPGSGKSVVAALASGSMTPTGGRVVLDSVDVAELDPIEIRRHVRVLTEDPFLFGRSLRDNLRMGVPGGDAVSDDVLHEALVAAGAETIVDELPDGLDSILGERGLTLSGGQRQRVALARALVCAPRVLVLDDALSAVNPALELEIARRIRTRFPDAALLFVTRREGLLALADRVVHLPDNALAHRAAKKAAAAMPSALPVGGGLDANLDPLLTEAFLEVPADRDEPEVSDGDAEWSDAPPTVRNILLPFRRKVALAAGILGVFTLASLLPEGLIGLAVDDFRDHTHSVADRVAVAIAVMAVVVGLLSYALKLFVSKISEGIMFLLRRRTFQRLSRLGVDYYDRELPGKVAARVVYDLDQISGFVDQGVYQIAVCFTLLVSVFGVMFVWSPPVAITVALFVPPLAIITAVQAPVAYRAYLRARDHLGEVVARLQEDVAGRYVIDAFGARQRASAEFRVKARDLRAARKWATSVSNVYVEIVQVALALATAALISRAGNLTLDGTLSIGSMIVLQLYLGQALAPIPLLFAVIQRYLAAKASFNTLSQPFEAPILPAEAGVGTPAPAFEGALRLSDVTFRYPGTERAVLHDVDLDIAPGEWVAVVGPTGAGKSSIAKLVARVYDPDTGSVEVDGTDVRSLELSSYRRRLGIVPQDAFCFRGTVSDNISYGAPGAGRDAIQAAARQVGAHEVLSAIPGGLDGAVEEEGRNLTAAQRQLIALARAVLVAPDVLILDEATSSLDTALEESVLDATRALGRTSVFITHRLSVAERADRVIVVDGGRIQEQGGHDELLAAGGAYASLWSLGADVDARRSVSGRTGRKPRRGPLKAAGR